MTQQQQPVEEVWAAILQTIVNNAIDQWSKQAFITAKGQRQTFAM